MSHSPTTTSSQPNDNVEEIHLGDLLAQLYDSYKLITAITLAFTLMAILYAVLATPIYQAQALVQIEQKQGSALLGSLSQMLPDSQPPSAPEITLLQSRMILGKTVSDLGLQTQISRRYFPVVGAAWAKLTGKSPGQISLREIQLPVHQSDVATATLTVIDAQHYQLEGEGFTLEGETGKTLKKEGVSLFVSAIQAEPGARFTITWVSPLQAVTDLQRVFSVAEQGRETGMLNLQLTGSEPLQIQTILKSICDNYLEQNIARQAARDQKSLDFLNAELPKIRHELSIAEDKLNDYRKKRDSVDLNLEAKTVLDQIVNVDNQLNELTFREAEVSQLYKKDHPTYRALKEKQETLLKEKGKLSERVSAMPSTQQEVLRLSRDVDSGRAVYLQLLGRQQELSVSKSSAIGNVRVIDEAVTLTKPVKPKKILIVMMGFILGAVISVGIVLMKTMLYQGIDSPEQLEECGINVYACVPHSKWLHKHNMQGKKGATHGLLALINPAEPAIETIRGLRTNMHFAMMEATNNILMISGVSPGAGKTFVSSNLAAVTAQGQKRVLFIDADMRKGYAHEIFGQQNTAGLSEVLSRQKTLDQVIAHIPAVGMDMIPRGKVPPNPSELLMHPGFKSLLESASARYDLVIIDTPPIMAVTDASIIGRYAGTVLMVTHFGVNTVKEVVASIRRFEHCGVTVKGCILNGVVRKAGSYYSYGYSAYGYVDSGNKRKA